MPRGFATAADVRTARPAFVTSPAPLELPEPIASETSHQTDLETPVETRPTKCRRKRRRTLLPFRPPGEAKPPSLTPVENSAFNELARQLSARLETENGSAAAAPQSPASTRPSSSSRVEPCRRRCRSRAGRQQPRMAGAARAAGARRSQARQGAARSAAGRRPDLPARPPALCQPRVPRRRWAMPSLHALEEAGGLDALYVEPGVSNASSTSDTGTPVTISASQPQISARRSRGRPTRASTRFPGTAIPRSR